MLGRKYRSFFFAENAYFRTRSFPSHVIHFAFDVPGTVAEWLGRALQKLLQQFESARYLTFPVPPKAGGIFFMLTPEEEKFVQYWADQRQDKKTFLRKFSIVLPLVSLAAVLFFVNFLSGWYGKADRILRRHSSMFIVILVALVAIVVFVVIFTVRHKWEQNEADYQALLSKRGRQETTG